MTRLPDAFDHLDADRRPRGAGPVLDGARLDVRRLRARRRFAGLGIVAVVVLLVGVGIRAGGEGGTTRVGTGPADRPPTAAPTDPATEPQTDPTLGSDQEPTATTRQDPAPRPTGTTADDVAPTTAVAPGPDAGPPTDPSPARGTTVEVHFGDARTGPDGLDCSTTRAVTRTVAGPGVLRGALEALLGGPTADEAAAGAAGHFSSATAGALRSVSIDHGTARVDLADLRRKLPDASSSCGSALLLAQLDRTVLQFPSVERALYSLDGDVTAFYEWLQRPAPDGPPWDGTIQVDHGSGTVRAPGFDDFVTARRPGWSFDPRTSARQLLGLDRLGPDDGTVAVDVEAPTGDRVRVVATISDLPDDSVTAERYVVTFVVRPDGSHHLASATWGVRCHAGRGHQDFRPALCV